MLTRYWFEFVRSGQATALSLGCGITASNLDDARRMLRQEMFPLYGDRTVARVIEGVEVASLDETGVRRPGQPGGQGRVVPSDASARMAATGKAYARAVPTCRF